MEAGKRISSFFEPADIYMLAQALFLGRHYRRAFHLLHSSKIVDRDLRFRYLAAKCLEELKDWHQCLNILGDANVDEHGNMYDTNDSNLMYLDKGGEDHEIKIASAICFLRGKAFEALENRVQARKGGETIFPHAKVKTVQAKDDVLSDCAKNGYSVKPYKGDALLFFSLLPNATTDPSSLHGSCPVIEGEKWSATKWIHVRSFEKSMKQIADGECMDQNVNCPTWAKGGECEKNPVYMVGSEELPGFCRKSCEVCSS